MNKVILIGNLCKDIELRFTQNNIAVMQNTLAVRNDFKNSNGEYGTQFVNVVSWNKQAEFLSKYCSKGSKILVEGRIETRNYDDPDGKRVYVTEVIAEKVEILNGKKEENNSFENAIQEPVTDDDLPF